MAEDLKFIKVSKGVDLKTFDEWARSKGFKPLWEFVREDMKIPTRYPGYYYNPAVCESVFLGEALKYLPCCPSHRTDVLILLPYNPDDGSDRPGIKVFDANGQKVVVMYNEGLAKAYRADPGLIPVMFAPFRFYHFEGAALVSDGYLKKPEFRPGQWGTMEPDLPTDGFQNSAMVGYTSAWLYDDNVLEQVGEVLAQQGCCEDCWSAKECARGYYEGLSAFDATKGGVFWALPAVAMTVPKEVLEKGHVIMAVSFTNKGGKPFDKVSISQLIQQAVQAVEPVIGALGYQIDEDFSYTIGGQEVHGYTVVISGATATVFIPVRRVSASLIAPELIPLLKLVVVAFIVAAIAATIWHVIDSIKEVQMAYYESLEEYNDLCAKYPELCKEGVIKPPKAPTTPTSDITNLVKWGIIAIVAINVLPALGEALRGGERD